MIQNGTKHTRNILVSRLLMDDENDDEKVDDEKVRLAKYFATSLSPEIVIHSLQ
jgi:hypothetical protein